MTQKIETTSAHAVYTCQYVPISVRLQARCGDSAEVGERRATERASFESALALLPDAEGHVTDLLARLTQFTHFPETLAVVDIGAAQGRFVIACAKRGYQAVGIEPWDQAIRVAKELAEHQNVMISMVAGTGENLPLESSRFDLVRANSVVEHVDDPQAVFSEACRVLKPGGAFWFSTTSSLCPRQHEISRFPCFGWYPDRLKRRIMHWAKSKRPDLIGHTEHPAVHWFTPWATRRMLRDAGFSRVYDRWDLRLPSQCGRLSRIALRAIRSNVVTKFIGDVLVPDSAYAAIK